MRGVHGVGWAPTTSTPLGVSSKLRPPSPFSAEGWAPVGHVPWRLSGKTRACPGSPPSRACGGHTQKLGRGDVEPGHAAGSRVLQSPGCLSPVQLGVLSASLLQPW